MGLENIWERGPKTLGSAAQILPELPNLPRKITPCEVLGGVAGSRGWGKLTKSATPCLLQGFPGKTGPRGGVVSTSASTSFASRHPERCGMGCEVWAWWCYSLRAAHQRCSDSRFSICRATRGWPASRERKARR